MKITGWISGLATVGVLGVGLAVAQPRQVGQDLKDAGHSTADATKTAGHDVAHGTTVATHKTVHGTKHVYHKTTRGTKHVAHKVEGKPDTTAR